MAKVKELVEEPVLDLMSKITDDYDAAPRAKTRWQSVTGSWMVPVELCDPDADVREEYDEAEDRDFIEGIRSLKLQGRGIEGTGIETPILLRPNGSRYLASAGRRRLRAAIAVENEFVPASIQDIGEVESEDRAIRENVARRGLSELEEGNAFLRMQGRGDSLPIIAEKMGKSTGYISNRLRVAKKPEDIKAMVAARPGTMAHADLIDTVKDEGERAALIEDVVKNKAPLEKVREKHRELTRRGLTKSNKTESRPRPENGSIGKTTKPAPVHVDWAGHIRGLADASARLMRDALEHPVRKAQREQILDALAAAEKDFRAIRQAVGKDGREVGSGDE